jgi:hypothetical protein
MDQVMNKEEVILIYTRPWFEEFYRVLAVQIEQAFKYKVVFFSDYAMKNVHNIAPYKRNLKKLDVAPPPEYFDVIKRDRLLRTEHWPTALGVLNAYEVNIASLFARYNVKFLFSATVDQFAIDMCYRQCIKEKIPFIGYHLSVIPGYTLLTARGEGPVFRVPSENEISAAIKLIASKTFRPSYIPKQGRLRSAGFLRLLANIARVPFFFFKDICEERYNYHYKSSFKGAYSNISFGMVKSLFSHHKKLSTDKRFDIYIPLQLHPECNSDYWNRNAAYKDYEDIIFEFCKRHAKYFRIAVKEHPNMVGVRDSEFYRKILGLNVDLINVEEDSRNLIKKSKITVTYNSSVGIEGLLYKVHIYCIGNPYYLTDGHISSENEMVSILKKSKLLSTEIDHGPYLRDAIKKTLSMSLLGMIPDTVRIKNQKQKMEVELAAISFASDLKKYFTDITATKLSLENVYTYKDSDIKR